MPDVLTREEFASAIQYMRNLEGVDDAGDPIKLVLPYDIMPMGIAGGSDDATCVDGMPGTTYQWNPPEYLEYPDLQIYVSPKPTWLMVLNAFEQAYIQRRKTELCDFLRDDCRYRITLAYGETDPLDEIFARLSGNQDGDADRDMLRIKYAAAKASVMATTTRAEVDALDISNWFA